MFSSVWCDALRAQKCLELRYDGFTRVIEVHAVGITKEGNEVARVWQVRGGSNSNEPDILSGLNRGSYMAFPPISRSLIDA